MREASRGVEARELAEYLEDEPEYAAWEWPELRADGLPPRELGIYMFNDQDGEAVYVGSTCRKSGLYGRLAAPTALPNPYDGSRII